jgi:hypothetical protein
MAVDDEHLTIGVLSALVRLGSHSRDSAAASGSAAIRAGLYGLRPEAPASLSHQRGHFGRDTYNDREVSSDPPPVDTMADLDAIATVGRMSSASPRTSVIASRSRSPWRNWANSAMTVGYVSGM